MQYTHSFKRATNVHREMVQGRAAALCACVVSLLFVQDSHGFQAAFGPTCLQSRQQQQWQQQQQQQQQQQRSRSLSFRWSSARLSSEEGGDVLSESGQEPVSRRSALQKSIIRAGATLSALALPQLASAVNLGGPDALRSRFGDKLRRAAKMMDELQQDVYNEEWELVATYPNAFRSLVPVFTKYTDAAFPSDDPVDTNTRVSLRYEVGRFFGAVERLKRATENKDSKEAESAFSAMSVAYDRYLKAGNLYETYDPITSTAKFYLGVSDKTLVFVPPSRDPPRIKDSVLLIYGPDKGKTGRMIGLEGIVSSGGVSPSSKAVVKLENKLGAIAEIKVLPFEWVAKQVTQ